MNNAPESSRNGITTDPTDPPDSLHRDSQHAGGAIQTEFVIRPLETADLPLLEWDGEFTNYRELFRQAYEEMRIGSRQLLVLIYKPDHQMAGQIFLQFSSSDPRYADGRTRGYLYALRVKPAFRNRGLGSWLIHTAEQELRSRGMRYATIGVSKENAEALRLYERLGYSIFADSPGEWWYWNHLGQRCDVAEPAWLMEKKL